MPKTITVSDETYEKIKSEVEADTNKEQKIVRLEIKNRWTGSIIYSSTKTTYKDAVAEAITSDADLRDADLRDADLRGANLSDANLSGANLRDADLRDAELINAKFYGRGGTKPLLKTQLPAFLGALGFVIED
jgi:predicted CopG family antitoxin